jgi:hypothetical protein
MEIALQMPDNQPIAQRTIFDDENGERSEHMLPSLYIAVLLKCVNRNKKPADAI